MLLSGELGPRVPCALQLGSPNSPSPTCRTTGFPSLRWIGGRGFFAGREGPDAPHPHPHPHSGGSPAPHLTMGAVGPSGGESASRGRRREPGRFGGGLWLFSEEPGRHPEAIPTFQKFLGTSGRGDAIYRPGERGTAGSGISPWRECTSPIPVPARPSPGEGGAAGGSGAGLGSCGRFGVLKGVKGAGGPGRRWEANPDPANWSPWHFGGT